MGTEKQNQEWNSKLASYEWIACYAQTELAHGSDVQNLGTVATFDPSTQEFCFHTPTVGDTKWWPGDLGMSATHGVVMARLITNGQDQGVLPFFIQLRDLKTHHVLPGVEVGDIGPKVGYGSKDNGFLKFTQHRAPVSSLLGKYYRIDKEGNFAMTGNPKIIYAAMMSSRTALLGIHTWIVFKAVHVACKYSILRKQFKDSKGQEILIIDYQLQKYKIWRFTARAYAMNLSVQALQVFLKKNSDAIEKKNDFSYLQESHVLLCGMKAFFTYSGEAACREMIQATGGHGFSYFSGLANLYLDGLADKILEGENTLLTLQIARHLLKEYALVKRGEPDKLN